MPRLAIRSALLLACLLASSSASAQTPAPATAKPATSPLTIHVGDADLLIGGFMDATAITRSTNTGNGLPTAFGSIPFTTSTAGNLSETRLSSQNSRLSLLATSTAGRAAIRGYVEADFGGNAPTNLVVTSNGLTFRMRLYWAQATIGTFEFLGGQSWSLMTPGRNGISPSPGDVFFSQLMDTNYQAGLTWGRTTQFRFVAHPSKNFAAAISFENPQQYVGSAVTLPTAFAASEVDNGGNAAAPNFMPDVIGKLSWDVPTGDTRQHVEVAGLVRRFKTFDQPTSTTPTATGTGASVNVNLEVAKGVRLIGNSFFSKGGGRYIANTNIPDFIIGADSAITLVTSKSIMGGVEANAGTKTLLFGYVSQIMADQATTIDPANNKAIGFGVASQTGANKTIQETSVGFNYSFFKDPKIGAMQLIAQFSYLTRTPFSVPTGTPSSANAKMFFFDLRYILP